MLGAVLISTRMHDIANGDGNIHFSVSQPASADKSAFLARRR